MGLVAFCEQRVGQPEQNPQIKALVDQVFMTLVRQVETDVRGRLAERIAEAEWAPKIVVNILALDEIEIARPVIAASPLLADADLIRLIVEATVEHQIEVARRPRIGSSVVEALLEQSQAPALLALAGNDTAQIRPQSMERLVDASRRMPALRAPLTRHPKLTAALSARLYTWVGQVLRSALAQRFQLDEAALSSAIDAAVEDVRRGDVAEPTRAEAAEDLERMETSLIDKLDAAGQLKPGYLLRTLREQKFGLFQAALAKLAGLEVSEIRRALNSDRPQLLALACIAAGVDRGAFATMLSGVRDLNGGRPDGGANGELQATHAFVTCPPGSATHQLRAALASL